MSRSIDQGEIHYNVEYTGAKTLLPKELMPRNLVITFKNDNIFYELLAPFGNSGICFTSNPSKKVYDTYLSLFTIKYYYAAEPGEINPGFEAMSGMEIRHTSRTAVICGLNCKNAEVTLPADRNKIYNIWYTNDIPIKDPNASNPFCEIDGVLMNFFFLIGNSEFHFEAQNIYMKNISDNVFDRKEKYTKVSREELNKFLSRMVNL